ncbi:NUDIX hydrolase [Rubripirellula lacrimiformis]|nr:NUDIX domain-containing protein [Rubripirellula lacrimiformis]
MTDLPIEDSYRFCPRCGHAHDSVGQIPFHCESCQMTLYLGPVAAVGGLIVNDSGELLLVRRARNPGLGQWGLPGGFVDRNESVEEALRREVHEETKLTLRETQYLMSRPNQYCYGGVTAPVIDVFFQCRPGSLDSFALDDDELDHHLWVRPTRDHLDNMAFESNRLAVEAWLKSSAAGL